MSCSYDYQNPKTRQIITIYQGMNDNHRYIDEDGLEWDRIFYSPGAIIDSIYNIDPKDSKKFVERTGKHRGKLSDIMQLSAELSERRKDKDGVDVVAEKNMDKYEKARCKGTIHPVRKKQKLKEMIGKLGAEIEL